MENLENTGIKTLLSLIKEHKSKCDGNCNLSMFSLYPLLEKSIGKVEAQKYIKKFI